MNSFLTFHFLHRLSTIKDCIDYYSDRMQKMNDDNDDDDFVVAVVVVA